MKPAIDQATSRLYLKGHTHGHGTASITAPLLRFTRARELWAHNGFLLNDLKILRRMTSNFGDKMGVKKRRGWIFLFDLFFILLLRRFGGSVTRRAHQVEMDSGLGGIFFPLWRKK